HPGAIRRHNPDRDQDPRRAQNTQRPWSRSSLPSRTHPRLFIWTTGAEADAPPHPDGWPWVTAVLASAKAVRSRFLSSSVRARASCSWNALSTDASFSNSWWHALACARATAARSAAASSACNRAWRASTATSETPPATVTTAHNAAKVRQRVSRARRRALSSRSRRTTSSLRPSVDNPDIRHREDRWPRRWRQRWQRGDHAPLLEREPARGLQLLACTRVDPAD